MTKLIWGTVALLSLAGCSGSGSTLTEPEESTPSMDPGRVVQPGSCQLPHGQSGHGLGAAA